MKLNFTHLLQVLVLADVILSCTAKKPAVSRSVVTKNRPSTPSQPAASAENGENRENRTITAQLPAVNREFRAAWVATVANINWPSRKDLTTDQQKAEAIAILNQLKEAHFNAVVFQARPSSDALYSSDLEPWSYFLTGSVGKAPEPWYDPLQFWIEEAHRRGLQLHVWMNPYRAHHSSGGPVTDKSIVRQMPGQSIRLKNGMYWLDPSAAETQNHVSTVIKDLVTRYDLDAVHIDDYFYPYAEYNGGRDFPDDRTWNEYLKAGGNLSRADWRRGNVNSFIKRINDEIKAVKPAVQFGISPFGIWKPGFPAGITGSSQYDELFADAKLWLNEGWLDYFSPQLYWKIGGAQDFSALLAWWQSENKMKRHLWPGLNTVGIRNVPDKQQEIVNQIGEVRRQLGSGAGVIHYSTDGFTRNPAMYSALQQAYSKPALVPLSPWIKAAPLAKPGLKFQKAGGNVTASWVSASKNGILNWVLYRRYGTKWEYEILGSETVSETFPVQLNGQKLSAIAVTAVDRLGNESAYNAVSVD